MRLFGALLLFATPALAAPDYEPWRTLNYGDNDTRTGAMTCTYDYPSTPCMHLACGPGSSLILAFTELGNTPDMKSNPAGPEKTKVTLTFPDGTRFTFDAKRVGVTVKGFNQVQVQGWDDSRVAEAFAALRDGDDTSLITAALPDGRESAFGTRHIGFAMGQAPRLCDK